MPIISHIFSYCARFSFILFFLFILSFCSALLFCTAFIELKNQMNWMCQNISEDHCVCCWCAKPPTVVLILMPLKCWTKFQFIARFPSADFNLDVLFFFYLWFFVLLISVMGREPVFLHFKMGASHSKHWHFIENRLKFWLTSPCPPFKINYYQIKKSNQIKSNQTESEIDWITMQFELSVFGLVFVVLLSILLDDNDTDVYLYNDG